MAKNSDLTVGQKAYELMFQEPTAFDPREINEAANKEYHECIKERVEAGLKEYDGDFFIVSEGKREALMPNILRNLVLHRKMCPIPHYNQVAYKYHRAQERLEFLWSVPERHTCIEMYGDPLAVPEENQKVLKSVLDFYDDTFLRLSQKMNGEGLIIIS